MDIETYALAKKYTDKKTSQSASLHREIVQSLPLTGDETVIYMVPITGSGDDNYDEYMWINNAYEIIGHTKVDLTDYYNKTQVDTALSGKASSGDIPTKLSDLEGDSTHRTVTDNEKTTWNGVDTRVSEHSLGIPGIDLRSYNSSGNQYVCPKDGYITLSVGGSKTASARVCGVEALSATHSSGSKIELSLFVRKGMNVYYETDGGAYTSFDYHQCE